MEASCTKSHLELILLTRLTGSQLLLTYFLRGLNVCNWWRQVVTAIKAKQTRWAGTCSTQRLPGQPKKTIMNPLRGFLWNRGVFWRNWKNNMQKFIKEMFRLDNGEECKLPELGQCVDLGLMLNYWTLSLPQQSWFWWHQLHCLIATTRVATKVLFIWGPVLSCPGFFFLSNY